MSVRVGIGYDVHQLAEGYELWLGGIKIEHEVGSKGHSDADVLLHVICDALLGAAALGDIGLHFPDTDPKYKGIDSKKLLAEVMRLIRAEGYEVGNVDATVAMQRPKLRLHIDAMRAKIAEVMGLQIGQVSVKATTTEKLGFVGREEGVEAYAVVLLSY